MSYGALEIVMLVFFAVIPALVVLAVCLAKIYSLKSDMTREYTLVNARCDKHEDKLSVMDSLHKSCTDAMSEANKATLRVQNLDESLASLTNKLSARERERKREEGKRRKEEPNNEDDYDDDIPGTEQQMLPFFDPSQVPQVPLPQQQETRIVKPNRKFGTIP